MADEAAIVTVGTLILFVYCATFVLWLKNFKIICSLFKESGQAMMMFYLFAFMTLICRIAQTISLSYVKQSRNN